MSNPDNAGFTRLLALARDGDKAAIGQLMSNYRGYLLLIANEDFDPTLRAKTGASDVVQQSLMAAHENIEQFQGSSENEFKAWIRRILKHDLLDNQRKYRTSQRRNADREHHIDDSRLEHPELAQQHNTPGTNAQIREQAKLLNKAIKELPEKHQTILQLRNWQDKSFAEIGEIMDCSADAARKLWYRAVVKLESAIKDTYPGLQSTIFEIISTADGTNDGRST